MVGEPVEQRAGEPLGAQHLRPVLKRQVGRHDNREQPVRPRKGARWMSSLGRFYEEERFPGTSPDTEQTKNRRSLYRTSLV